jgi:hypothetical protein
VAALEAVGYVRVQEPIEGHEPRERQAGMYAVVRTYTGQGASELFDLLGQREEDVKALLSGVSGFVNYAAVRTDDGGVTVTVCETRPARTSPPDARRNGSRKTSARQPTRP